MVVNATQHQAIVNEEDGPEPFRWECLCRRTGKWVATRTTAEKGGAAHVRRYAPKPKTSQGPKALRELLRF